jgi:RHS repeat-associated protein
MFKGNPSDGGITAQRRNPLTELTPRVTWQRSYISNRALAEPSGYGSPGLSRGWVHNYDLSIQGTSGSWGALKLIYANGASETVTPQLSGGVPTGSFTTPAGAPYTVSGISGTPTGTWQSLTVTWKDQTKWKFTLLSGTTYALTQLSNRTGQSLNLTWNSSRALTQISDASTSTVLLTLAYASNGKLATATDVYGRQVAYTFSAPTGTTEKMLQAVSQMVTSGTVNPPAQWTFGYAIDKGQQLSTIAVPSPTGSGNSTATINYDSIGKISSLVDANGNQRIYTYNSGNTVVQVKDSANNLALSWTQKFNTSGLDTGITDAANHSTTVAYTSSTNPLKPTSVTDRNGHITTYTYDQFGNVLTVTSPRNVTTTYTWSYTNFALGRLTSIQEGSKPATTITYYEPSGLVQTITKPEPNNGAGTTTTTFTYDSLGNVLTIVRPGNDTTTSITTTLNYTTDGGYSQAAKIGQPLTVTDNLGHITHLRYDAQGRATAVTDALGNETDFTYNLIGQSDTTTYPATGQTGSGHSHTTNAYLYVGGPLTTATAFDESNTQVRQVTRNYGLEGESLSVSGSVEPVTNTYDALYRVKTLKDGNNNTTTYAYNNVGLVSSVTMPGSEITQFTSYDNAGNLLQRIDGNNVTTNYVYNDAESLLTDIQYPASTSLNVHFGYDGYGRRSAMSDGTGSQSYGYGNLDELLSTTTTYTGLAAKTISYAYYPDGSRQTMTTPAGTFTYSYDAGGRPASMTNPFSETTSWAYQNNNWLSTQTLANGAVATHTHNALGQVTELLNQIGSTTISDFSSIAYDGVGNRNSVTANIPGATSLSGTTGYAYDSKDQITQETSTRNGGFTDNFGYDSAGNPTSFKGITKSYNSNNQQSGTGFSHDGNGNPTNYGGTALTFDPENRMTAYGSVLTSGYTGDGLRAWKQNASARTYFLYDGTAPVVELDSSGVVSATNTLGTSGLVSRREGSTTVFYSFDSEGNVTQRSDETGSVLSIHFFSAHGSTLSGASTDPFGYKAQFGYYTDNETGLQLLTHRHYDQLTGRFLTRDPIHYSGGINLYAYVGNSPVDYSDPSGLERLSYTLIPGKPAPPVETNPIRLPDFYTFQINLGPPAVPLGWSGQVIVDRHGRIYLQPLGFNLGKSFPAGASAAVTFGWINQRCEPTQKRLNDVLSDQSIGVGGGFFGGGEFTGNRNGSTTQIGVLTPQIGGSWGYAFPWKDTGLEQSHFSLECGCPGQ